MIWAEKNWVSKPIIDFYFIDYSGMRRIQIVNKEQISEKF